MAQAEQQGHMFAVVEVPELVETLREIEQRVDVPFAAQPQEILLVDGIEEDGRHRLHGQTRGAPP